MKILISLATLAWEHQGTWILYLTYSWINLFLHNRFSSVIQNQIPKILEIGLLWMGSSIYLVSI
jgi:hypothetical protein